ncbi:uncharacterized protein LOC143286689 isoform X3 [Babylonia areolata]|uniref:uncharacterized protein LOC143286689 isoform X3 n=1 Tax=Babylonia areolata TaxID=304850 RepID=UPI003FD320C9
MLSHQANVSSALTSPVPADVSSASILKSVQEQEAQFERLARQLEAERERVSHRQDKGALGVGPDSPSPSMNSVSQDESFTWASPLSSQPPHASSLQHSEEQGQSSRMSSTLLDSCLRELEDRGTLNTGYIREEGGMDYMHPEYSHGGGDSFYSPQAPYGGGVGTSYANTSFDRGSHASLHSTGSNRPRQGQRPGEGMGGGQNYSPYGHPDDMPRDDYPGSRNSYNQPGDGYGGQGYHDNYGDPGNTSHPSYRDSPMGDPQMMGHQGGGYGEGPQGGGYGDYPDERDLQRGPPYDDSYRESPYHHQEFGGPPPNGRMDDDRYSDRGDSYGPPHQDDSFQGMRPGEQPGQASQPSFEQDHYPDDPRQRTSYEQDAPRQRGSYDQGGPPGIYGMEDEPRYRGSYDQGGPGYGGPPIEESGPRYRGSYDQEGPQGHYTDPPPNDHAPPQYGDSYDDRGYGGGPPEEEAPRYRGSYQDEPPMDPSTYDETRLKYEGLPPVQSDPFADDPFREQRSQDGSFSALREDPYHRGPSPYNRGPSPTGDTRPPDGYDSQPYSTGDGGSYPPATAPSYDDYTDSRPYQGDLEQPYYPEDQELMRRMEAMNVAAPPGDGYHHDDRRTPSMDGRPPVGGYIRPPDLQEVIDYLSYPDDSVKANAAAYLQHISYNDDGIKAKTRGLDGIGPLVQMLSHELTEVHKNACGALQNLSFGKANDENKKAIKNEGGIPELIRLLRKTDQEDVMDSVTGILWNLSSCEDLKRSILEDGLTVLVNQVVLKYAGWGTANPQPWTTVFRNTTGILRNISSAGYEARKKLRECRGLVDALTNTLKIAHDEIINCKPVENVVCTLRNLSYRIQEMEDPDFYKKRAAPRNATNTPNKGESTGCFGGGNKKAMKKGSVREPVPQLPPPNLPDSASEYRALWGNELLQLYLGVWKTCTNPVTLEASAGAVQNLTACDWAPAVECRAFIRKAKGLPNLVDLLNSDSHRVVCAAATALRNLTIDHTNKELIGKYSIRQLVDWLPRDSRHSANQCPDDLTCAVLATLYEVVRSNQDHAVSLIQEDGLSRLMYINTSEGRFLARTLKINHTILKTLWTFKALHLRFTRMGYSENDFVQSMAKPRPDSQRDAFRSGGGIPSSNHTTPYNTLSRPISAQGYDDNTLSAGRMPRHDDGGYYGHHGGSRTDMDSYFAMNQSNPALYGHNDRGNYSRDRIPPESIPINDLGPGYAPLDEPRPHKKPVGGVPLFPNLPPGAAEADQSSQELSTVPEPLYAQVNKGRRRNEDYGRQGGVMMDGSGGQGGADSWV